MKKYILTIIMLLVSSICYAQAFTGDYNDFGSNFANGIYTDTNYFSGDPLGASDVSVQLALQSIDAYLQTTNLVSVLCAEGKINCIYDTVTDCPNTDRCFVYEDELLKVYVDNTLQSQWPIVAEEYHLLLDDGVGGFKLLLDDGVGGFFLIIK